MLSDSHPTLLPPSVHADPKHSECSLRPSPGPGGGVRCEGNGGRQGPRAAGGGVSAQVSRDHWASDPLGAREEP